MGLEFRAKGLNMLLDGKEIYRGYDEYGPVLVIDDGTKRYLSFGEGDEQSCWLKSEPHLPQLDYIRAMCLVLLLTEPKRIISLGLGAGTLNSCLHYHFPESVQQIVELRREVIDVAHRYFQLPRGKRIQTHHMDAKSYLDCVESKPADIIFSDIYDENGVDEQQHDPAYLHECYERLKPKGWLVLNCWKEHKGETLLTELSGLFDDIRTCTTQEGNWIVFAGKQSDTQTQKQLKQQAKLLSQKLGFALCPYLNRMNSLNEPHLL